MEKKSLLSPTVEILIGIIFSSILSWSLHYDPISAMAYRKLGLIRRAFFSSICRKKWKAPLSLVRSQLTYCSQIWGPYLIKNITLLEKIQRQATKFILKDHSSDYWSRLISLHLIPLIYLYEIFDVLFLWGVWSSQTKVSLLEITSPYPKPLLLLPQLLTCMTIKSSSTALSCHAGWFNFEPLFLLLTFHYLTL